jgi:hypothetical protein
LWAVSRTCSPGAKTPGTSACGANAHCTLHGG